ncbi:NACHT domain-containing protein (plasmid) [Nostoc sp. UHCC 0926]|uniref:NACHT domain-containing protein n=1 Tax=Nostoc sp. UHCC 0926 TaxID=3025190 RepID=UPI002360AADC|nr:NACHT domain-containing protein [Nostoc sp. UHCC 0926]WDD36405.1 NACHT domain-containing protein [Nostoc sp. UHCC 0926]
MQQVRSRIHDSIQSLHGVMPLWGIDHWVPLGDLFVDVNILESLSSSRRSELDDLWQDFTTGNSSYRSLDRIGLGKEQQRVSGLTVLERNTNLMMVGKPGSGKTTYLQRIVTECNDGKLQAQRIPVLIKLREFVDDGRKYVYNLEQFLGQLWRLNNAEIELVLNQGRVLVLLDGLDEVAGEAGKQIAKKIKRFARAYPQVQVVVTCRTQSQESRFERFDYVEVADFNEEQVRAFAEHWFGTVCADAGKGKTKAWEFLEQLFREENKAIRELAITPILLSLTCAVFQQTGKFYSKRSKLYEEGLELLLVQWDKSRSVERDEIYRDLLVERKLELLSYVAVKKFEQQQYVLFEQEELEGYIGEFLGIERRDSRGVLRAIASQHGLLIERAHKVWSFSHLTFQEYLVAKWFYSLEDWEELVSHITDEHWREVFFLLSGITKNADTLLLRMKQQVDLIMASDSKLQKFLEWIHDKSISINQRAKFNPYAKFSEIIIGDGKYVKGYYFLDNLNVYNLTATRAFYIDISIAFYIDNDINCQCIRVRSLARALDINFNYDLDNCFNLNVTVDRELIRTLKRLLLEPFYLKNDWLIEQHLHTFHGLQPELERFFTNFQSQLSSLGNQEMREKWVQKYSKYWIEQLKNLIIKYRNIGYDWQFNDKQKLLIKKYYYSNKLLIDCLGRPELSTLDKILPISDNFEKILSATSASFINYAQIKLKYLEFRQDSGSIVSDNVKKEIEETLLLPLTEIENCKYQR